MSNNNNPLYVGDTIQIAGTEVEVDKLYIFSHSYGKREIAK